MKESAGLHESIPLAGTGARPENVELLKVLVSRDEMIC
jgi:hypothetical protein